MTNLVTIENNQVVVSSRQVAERFEKRHDSVIRNVEEIIKTQNCGLTNMFIETSYQAGTGKNYKEYLMNRDGFSLLTMSFTGSKAMEWKLKYIQAFNEMEQRLNKPMTIEDMIIAQCQSMKEVKQKLATVQIEQSKQKQELSTIRDTIVVRPSETRQWVTRTINAIIRSMGGAPELYVKIKTETYQLLNDRLGVNVYTRRANKAKAGVSTSIISIILSDKKLTEGYIAILKEYAIKCGVSEVA